MLERRELIHSLYAAGALFACLIIIAFPLFAQALEKTDDIDTNRPSFTDSPLVVPKFSLQLENGTQYQHLQHGGNYWDASETEVRFGLTDKTEFQMFVPNFALLRTAGPGAIASTGRSTSVSTSSLSETLHAGVSDLAEIGLKRQLKPILKDMNIALIAGVSPPTGSRFLSGTGTQGVFRMPWTKPLNAHWTICGMPSFILLNQARNSQYQQTAMLCRSIGTRTTLFTEYAGFYTRKEFPVNFIHFGVVRKLDRTRQLDIHFGFGLNKSAPAAFVGVGYSFRFDHFPKL